ncbi:MAG: hypothetical protein EXQ70_11270 [Solirubrobacterales bacterium]|nr:hypothetical protein [Solirubrobacterales bacterium]
MARALIVACGCHGRELGAALLAEGWQVRGTTRGAGVEGIEAAGIEAAVADPDSPGTILELVNDTAVVVWLLGDAAGEPEAVAAIHGPRLERLLEKLVDTPVRGFAYEAGGGVPDGVLAGGSEIVERAGEHWMIPVVFLEGDRGGPAWAGEAASVTKGLLGG